MTIIQHRKKIKAIYFIIKMKRNSNTTLNKKPVSPVKSTSPAHTSTSQVNTLYFCHYRNAMYMGGVKNFKKEGKGILIHDNGLSIICSYLNDLMHGHNVFYAQHCLLSAEFTKGKISEAVYRTDGFLAHFFFNSDDQLDGKCKLLNYTAKSITYATFRKGILLEKAQQSEFTVLNRVFDLGQLELLLGRVHQKAIKYQIEKDNYIEGQKYGNKLVVGFEKGGLLNGLGFTLIFRGSHGGYNPDTHRNQDQFQLKIIQRGYMQNSQLNGFGDKLFKNGNQYIGEFKNGLFEGNGLLRNTAKKNWVSGLFEKGNLVDLFEYNNQGGQKRYDKIIEAFHERKNNWINNEVVVPSIELFDRMIQKILADAPSASIKTLEQRKQQVLKKIQQNFLCDGPSMNSFMKTTNLDFRNLQADTTSKNETIRHFVHSFIPEAPDEQILQKENQKQPTTGKYILNKKAGQDIRKSKIFDKSLSSDKYTRLQNISGSKIRASKTPEQKKKIFAQKLVATTQKSSHLRDLADTNSPEGQLRGLETDKKQELFESGVGLPFSEDNLSSSSKEHSRAKSSRRNKIFNYLQDKSEQAAPKFIYNKVDTLPQSERRRRMGLDEHV